MEVNLVIEHVLAAHGRREVEHLQAVVAEEDEVFHLEGAVAPI